MILIAFPGLLWADRKEIDYFRYTIYKRIEKIRILEYLSNSTFDDLSCGSGESLVDTALSILKIENKLFSSITNENITSCNNDVKDINNKNSNTSNSSSTIKGFINIVNKDNNTNNINGSVTIVLPQIPVIERRRERIKIISESFIKTSIPNDEQYLSHALSPTLMIIKCHEIYGDPEVLFPRFYKFKINKKYVIRLIPQCGSLNNVIDEILTCKYIVSESLHACSLSLKMKKTLNFQEKNNLIPLSKIFQKIFNYELKIYNSEYNITINNKEYLKVALMDRLLHNMVINKIILTNNDIDGEKLEGLFSNYVKIVFVDVFNRKGNGYTEYRVVSKEINSRKNSLSRNNFKHSKGVKTPVIADVYKKKVFNSTIDYEIYYNIDCVFKESNNDQYYIKTINIPKKEDISLNIDILNFEI
ncbi:hypothetical protein H8356DRAFT_1395143 [Neocallimastix lanati (nom. inval.)]|nr:hypothetical protein H8356DRAFT_1395143 [Neocallimastix sp. JGI-2020a]